MVRMMGLLSSRLDLDNQKYILVLHALELLANETNDHLQTVAGFLLSSSFDEVCPTYRKNDIGTIVYDDDGYAGTFQKTWEILKYFHTTSPHHFYESNYRENYWLRSEFFSFLIEHKITNIPSVIDWIAKNPTDTQTDEIEQQTAILQRDPLLTNLDIFSIVEASCLISGDNPIQVNICSNDTNFWQTYDEYLKAESFISAGIKSGKLDSDITRQSLQKYLLEKSYVIEGFNDNLPPVTADKIGHATITQTTPTANQLSQQVADQQATIDQQAKKIAQLKNDYEALKQGYGFLETTNKALIEQAGKDTQSDTPADRGQGDSLLILGAVMSTIEQVAKTNYTQASFIENHILPKYGHINGISESTLQKKFSQAKTYLKQKV